MADFPDPVLLSRIQYAFTISFHIIFPSFTIGLASWLAWIELLWLKTKQPHYKDIYKFWVKIFAVAFGMGVVSGVVMSYEFGTNWALFSRKVANVMGPLLGFEVLTAFFLEASFLGIMLFGWGKVSARMHFVSTVIVAVGTVISAFWILSANSWMHTPAGFKVGEDGILYPLDWLEIIFNASFPYRFSHMIVAAYLTTGFVIAGVASWYMLKGRYTKHARTMFSTAIIMITILAPLQILIGDQHGLNTLEHQPRKVAAMEGIWDDEKGAALNLFGIPNEETEETKHAIQIPKLGSLILTHSLDGEVKGLKNWAPEDRPPVKIVFFSFRIMVGIGILMLITGVVAIVLRFKNTLYHNRMFQRWCVFMSPMGFIAILAGWIVTEVGRQPYVVYGILRTKEMASKITGAQTLVSLSLFVAVYTFVFGMAIYYIFKLISKGPSVSDETPYGDHGKEKAVIDHAQL